MVNVPRLLHRDSIAKDIKQSTRRRSGGILNASERKSRFVPNRGTAGSPSMVTPYRESTPEPDSPSSTSRMAGTLKHQEELSVVCHSCLQIAATRFTKTQSTRGWAPFPESPNLLQSTICQKTYRDPRNNARPFSRCKQMSRH